MRRLQESRSASRRRLRQLKAGRPAAEVQDPCLHAARWLGSTTPIPSFTSPNNRQQTRCLDRWFANFHTRPKQSLNMGAEQRGLFSMMQTGTTRVECSDKAPAAVESTQTTDFNVCRRRVMSCSATGQMSGREPLEQMRLQCQRLSTGMMDEFTSHRGQGVSS